MPVGLQILIAIVVFATVIGAIAQFLSKLNLAAPNQIARRPGVAKPAAGRTSANEIDKFLAEIDRLRKKQPEPPPQPRPATLQERIDHRRVARSVSAPEPPPPPPAEPPRRQPAPQAFTHQQAMRLDELPMAKALAPMPSAPPPPAAPAQPATRVTRSRVARPSVMTPFANTLAGLLASPQAVPMAVVLQEVLGPPKCRRQG